MKRVQVLLSAFSVCLFSVMCDDNVSKNDSTLDEGLIAHFPFDSEIETKANLDITHSDVEFVADRNGKPQSAARFSNSSSMKADVGSEFSLSELTISAWVKQEDEGYQSPRIVAVGPANTPAQYYSLIFSHRSDPRPLWFYCTDGSSGDAHTIGPSPILSDTKLAINNTWQHVAVTFHDSKVCFYIDGKPDNTVQTTGSITQFTEGVLVVGFSDYNSYDSFEGCIDDLRIYNRVLTADEISELASL